MMNKKRVRVFTKKELGIFFGFICITDWRSTLKNNCEKNYCNYEFLERNEIVLIIPIKIYVLTFVF